MFPFVRRGDIISYDNPIKLRDSCLHRWNIIIKQTMNTCICYDIAGVEKKIIISKIEDLFVHMNVSLKIILYNF